MEISYTPSADAIAFGSAQITANVLGILGQIRVIHAFTSSSGRVHKLHNLPHAWPDVCFPKHTTEQ